MAPPRLWQPERGQKLRCPGFGRRRDKTTAEAVLVIRPVGCTGAGTCRASFGSCLPSRDEGSTEKDSWATRPGAWR